jgi:hypothetical protein
MLQRRTPTAHHVHLRRQPGRRPHRQGPLLAQALPRTRCWPPAMGLRRRSPRRGGAFPPPPCGPKGTRGTPSGARRRVLSAGARPAAGGASTSCVRSGASCVRSGAAGGARALCARLSRQTGYPDARAATRALAATASASAPRPATCGAPHRASMARPIASCTCPRRRVRSTRGATRGAPTDRARAAARRIEDVSGREAAGGGSARAVGGGGAAPHLRRRAGCRAAAGHAGGAGRAGRAARRYSRPADRAQRGGVSCGPGAARRCQLRTGRSEEVSVADRAQAESYRIS